MLDFIAYSLLLSEDSGRHNIRASIYCDITSLFIVMAPVNAMEHVVVGLFGLSCLLQAIAIPADTRSLYYAGTCLFLLTCFTLGLYWLLGKKHQDVFAVVLVISSVLYWLWILLLPLSVTAMMILSWLTLFVLIGSLCLVHSNSKWGLAGISAGAMLLQGGYTLFFVGRSTGGSVALIVLGAIAIISIFYYDRWVKSDKNSNLETPAKQSEETTRAIAVGSVDYGATSSP